MILEGIVTTTNPDGSANIAPMGPIVDESFEALVLRPYRTAQTFLNLKRTRQGVFHVTDDVELLARAAVDRVIELPVLQPAHSVTGWILTDACRWFAFEVRAIDESAERTRIDAQVVDRGELRSFFGLNRAKHAVVEAAILATRTAFLPAEEIACSMAALAPLVEKTGGAAEQRAFAFLAEYIRAATASSVAPAGDDVGASSVPRAITG